MEIGIVCYFPFRKYTLSLSIQRLTGTKHLIRICLVPFNLNKHAHSQKSGVHEFPGMLDLQQGIGGLEAPPPPVPNGTS